MKDERSPWGPRLLSGGASLGVRSPKGPMSPEVKKIAALSGALASMVAGLVLATEVQGTLQSVHPVAGQLVFNHGSTLAVNADTQIWVNRRQGKLADLQPGEEIKARFRREDGQNVATRIVVTPGAVSRLERTGSPSNTRSFANGDAHYAGIPHR